MRVNWYQYLDFDVLQPSAHLIEFILMKRDKFAQIHILIFDLSCHNFPPCLPFPTCRGVFFLLFQQNIKNLNLFAFDTHDKSNFEKE